MGSLLVHVDYTKYYQFDGKNWDEEKQKPVLKMFFWSSQKKEIPEKNSAYEIDFV